MSASIRTRGRRSARRGGLAATWGHRLVDQLLGLVGVAAPQRQLGQPTKQRPGVLGPGNRYGEQAPHGLQPRLGGVQVAKAQPEGGPASGKAT